jgi:hypothetical protein
MGKAISSIFGGSDGSGEMEQANRLTREQLQRLAEIYVPGIAEQEIQLSVPELLGLLEAEQLGRSRFEDVEMDPRLQAAQRSALEEVSGLAKTGLGPEDIAAFNEVRRQAAAQAQAQRATALQSAQERGMLGSGEALLADLQGGQAASQMASQQGEQLAARAAEARRAALGQQASMAAQMQGQQLGLAGQKASAADAIAQFNAQQRMGVQAQNLASRQALANQAAATRNQEQMYNKGLLQQRFQNELAKASGQGQATSNLAGQYMSQAQAAQQGQQALVGGLLQAGGTLGAAALTSDINSKTNIESFSSDEFLGKLKPYKYDYKDESDGKGKQAGVMAQDLEETEVGKQAVIDTPKGKVVDYNKLGPTMLSSLVELNERLKKVEGK